MRGAARQLRSDCLRAHSARRVPTYICSWMEARADASRAGLGSNGRRQGIDFPQHVCGLLLDIDRAHSDSGARFVHCVIP